MTLRGTANGCRRPYQIFRYKCKIVNVRCSVSHCTWHSSESDKSFGHVTLEFLKNNIYQQILYVGNTITLLLFSDMLLAPCLFSCGWQASECAVKCYHHNVINVKLQGYKHSKVTEYLAVSFFRFAQYDGNRKPVLNLVAHEPLHRSLASSAVKLLQRYLHTEPSLYTL